MGLSRIKLMMPCTCVHQSESNIFLYLKCLGCLLVFVGHFFPGFQEHLIQFLISSPKSDDSRLAEFFSVKLCLNNTSGSVF